MAADRDVLLRRLKAVGYYRLCAYWHPFKQTDDLFAPNTTFETVWERYTFDRQLRLAVMDAIERVEVAVRASLINVLAMRGGPFAHLNIRNFPSVASDQHARLVEDLRELASRSSEVFVEHFKATYDEFPDLPIWAAAETMSFGNMLTLFRMSGKHVQNPIAADYKLTGKVFLSWLLTLNYVRNLCAHHSRLWNRELALRPILPDLKHDGRWHGPRAVSNRRIFVVLTMLHCLVREIAPQTGWRNRLYAVFDRFPNIPLRAMGIPADWRTHDLWQ